MNTIIQNILAFSAVGLAIVYLVRKHIWPPKTKPAKSCGGDDGCGCH